MNPYRAILNLVVAHIAEIRSSVMGRGLEPDVPLLFGVLRFAPEVCPQKPVSRLIAYAFILDHYCAQMCTAAMAIWRISLSVPSTGFFPWRILHSTCGAFPGAAEPYRFESGRQFQLKQNITGTFAWVRYWRESTHDGIYAFGSETLIDPAVASAARDLARREISRFSGLRRLT
jgi:hypothetical protein